MDVSDAFSGTKVETDEFILKPMVYDDLEEMANWPKFKKKEYSWANFPAKTDELRKRWYNQQQKGHLQWIIIRDRGTNELIGRCSVSEPLSGSTLMFGIVIHPHMLGQGLGTKITRLMLSYIFAVTDIDEVWLESRYDNERAHNTWNSVGFQSNGMHYRREIFGRYDRYIGYSFYRNQPNKSDLPSIQVRYLA